MLEVDGDILIIPKLQAPAEALDELASEKEDRCIAMGKYGYAVISPAHYNLKPSRHKTYYHAYQARKKLQNAGFESIKIFSCDGKEVG